MKYEVSLLLLQHISIKKMTCQFSFFVVEKIWCSNFEDTLLQTLLNSPGIS